MSFSLFESKRAYWNKVNTKIVSCLKLCQKHLSTDDEKMIQDYLEHNELGLAAETLVDIAMEDGWDVSNSTRLEILSVFEIMQYDERKEARYETYKKWASE